MERERTYGNIKGTGLGFGLELAVEGLDEEELFAHVMTLINFDEEEGAHTLPLATLIASSNLVLILSSRPAANAMGTRKSACNISSTISTVTSEDLIDSDAETDMDPEQTLIGDEQDIQPLDIQTLRAQSLYPHDSVVWYRAIWTTGASRDSMHVPTKIGLFGFIGRLLRPGLTDDEDWRYYYGVVLVITKYPFHPRMRTVSETTTSKNSLMCGLGRHSRRTQNSERSLESNRSGSALGAGSDDGFELDLGPEDGLGDVEEEVTVEEGYSVM
ncbi:hypothetical protein B0H14DRAFT_2619831 [Mycena olivaceomarginata]|nr:hypothetical protein B0H14DRAFT_2619831 [Mycena olivaceomarginata]